jgi:O-antigen ligase/tetratricopeptide (TPR) repeat protein
MVEKSEVSNPRLRLEPATKRISSWRSLSVAPSTTAAALLKLLGYIAILSVIILYPLAPRNAGLASEVNFERLILLGLVTSGFVASFIGLVNWSSQSVVGAGADVLIRARGPYANPDHFACFLTMTFPLAFAAAAFDLFTGTRRAVPVRVFCGVAAFTMVAALLLSGSRSGWAGLLLGLVALPLMTGWPANSFASVQSTKVIAAAALFCLLLLVFIGRHGQEGIRQRFESHAATAAIADRVDVWKDSLSMLRHFPLFGVGLRCWSELFPHFARPPWTRDSYWGETHNDYLQILCELGIAGFTIVFWFIVLVLRLLVRGARRAEPGSALVAAVTAAVVGVGLEEFFDFGLQLPANGLIFVVLLGVGLRLVLRSNSGSVQFRSNTPPSAWPAVGFAAGICLALTWSERSASALTYQPTTLSEAQALVLAHPADPDAHLSLLEQLGPSMSRPEFLSEVQRIMWFEPTNPYARDLYAVILLKEGNRSEGLAQIKNSFLFSPVLDTHRFLFRSNPQLARLSSDEKDAIRAGLSAAVARRYQDADGSLGDFYNTNGEYTRAADTYLAAATAETEPVQKSTFLTEAAISEVAAHQLDHAQANFQAALSLAPERVEPYARLMGVMLRKKDPGSARAVLDRAIKHRVDPLPLYVLLVQGEADVGDHRSAEAVALEALDNYPDDREITRLLGTIYLSESRYTDAALLFRRLCELKSDDADAFFNLGIAQEHAYEFSAAETAFQQAIRLSPANRDYRKRYTQFESNMIRSRMAPATAG